MSLESITSDDIKRRLKNLRQNVILESLNKEDDIIYEFASLLADRLQAEINPPEFYNRARLLIYDLSKGKGIETLSGQKIRNKKLINLDSSMYTLLLNYIPNIAYFTCPATFAKRVKLFYEDN